MATDQKYSEQESKILMKVWRMYLGRKKLKIKVKLNM